MSTPHCLHPDLPTLERGLSALFERSGIGFRTLSVVDRRNNAYRSAHPSEIVTCRFDQERTLGVLCKYGHGRSRDGGLLRGVHYEAAVYDKVIGPRSLTSPRFYGFYADPASDEQWLAIDYLDRAVPAHEAPEPDAMVAASRWIARFHFECETNVQNDVLPCLNRVGVDDFLQPVQAFAALPGSKGPSANWVASDGRRYRELIERVFERHCTVVHGDYYSENVIVQDALIVPVDWEFAAIAFGEMDLAALTLNWPAEIVEQCEVEYEKTRWPEGAPDGFRLALDVARLNLCFEKLRQSPYLDPDEWPGWIHEILEESSRWLD